MIMAIVDQYTYFFNDGDGDGDGYCSRVQRQCYRLLFICF